MTAKRTNKKAAPSRSKKVAALLRQSRGTLENVTAKKTPRTTVSTSVDARRAFGRARPDGEARFPVAPPKTELPSNYGGALEELKKLIQETRLRTVLSASAAMIQLYWEMGQRIRERQARVGWGAKVIDRLSADLREAFPDMSGLSSRNLGYMRDFAAA
jgi:hypothetical protein